MNQKHYDEFKDKYLFLGTLTQKRFFEMLLFYCAVFCKAKEYFHFYQICYVAGLIWRVVAIRPTL